jgi:hypothetical protein
MPDQMAPTVLTVDPAGNVGANFTGHIHATGLDLDAALGNVQNLNEIRWLRTSDGAVVAALSGNILGTQGGAGADYSGFLNVLADAVGALTSAEVVLTAISNFDPTTGTQLLLASAPGNALGDRHQAIVQCDDDGGIGVHQAVILDGSGRSNFQQVFDGTNVSPLLARRTARDFGRLTFAQFATLTGAVTPLDGDEVTLLADAANGVAWRMQYYATGAKWMFVGGTPVSVTATPESTASLAYVALATAQQFTCPRAGVYRCEYNWLNQHTNANGLMQGAVFVGAVEYIDAWDISAVANQYQPTAGQFVIPAAAGDVLALRFRTNVGTATFGSRFFGVTPVYLT